MINIKLTGQQRILARLIKLKGIDNLVRMWMESGEVDQIMNESFEKNFLSEGRPKWDPLKEVTKRTRRAKGFGDGPILHETGNLMDEITSLKGAMVGRGVSREWGVNQLRASERAKFKAHQTGARDGGKTIPKRKMIGFQPEDAKELSRSLGRWIFKQLQ